MIRSLKDFWSGLLYMFFGLAAVIIARDLDMGTALRMGPAYFPTVLGWLLAAIGAISVARGFLTRGDPLHGLALKPLLIIVGATLLFGFIVRQAGLAVALPVLVLFSAIGSRRFRWAPTLLLAAGLTLFCVLVFLKGLGVPLPIVGEWFGG
jgi:putative tricarboxylic transport membrane protein